MMKKIDLMIFDLDGTIASTGDDLVLGINHTLKTLNLRERTKKDIIGFVGDGISKLMERALGSRYREYQEEAMRIFSAYYAEHLLDNTKLYPHVEEVLRNFENKPKVVLTNKRYPYALMIVRGLKIEKYFTEVIGADSTPFLKPDRRIIDSVLEKHPAERHRALIVGDGVNDIAVARNSGIMSCAFLNGLGRRDDLLKAKADYYCEDILEVNRLFR